MKELIIAVPDDFGKKLKPEKVNSEIKGELVRCKDCVKSPDEHKAELNGELHRHCELHRRWTTDDWFCADGKRKDTDKL